MPIFPFPMLLHCVWGAQLQWHEGPADWLSVHVHVHAHTVALWQDLLRSERNTASATIHSGADLVRPHEDACSFCGTL